MRIKTSTVFNIKLNDYFFTQLSPREFLWDFLRMFYYIINTIYIKITYVLSQFKQTIKI